jgi:hypothetical protein
VSSLEALVLLEMLENVYMLFAAIVHLAKELLTTTIMIVTILIMTSTSTSTSTTITTNKRLQESAL